MNNLKNISKKLFILVILISSIFPYSLYARTSREIADEIRKQQEALKNAQESLKQAQQNINVYSDLLENKKGGLPQLEGEIKKLEAEIEANKFELDLNEKQRDLRELEKEQRMLEQNSSIKGVYMNWRVESGTNLKDALHAFDFKKYEVYSSVLTNYQTGNLEGITNKINRLESDIEKYNKKLAILEEKNTQLSKKKKDLEEQIRNYQNALAYNSYQIGNLNNSANQLRGTISSLSAEQAAAMERERQLMENNPGVVDSAGCDGSVPPEGHFYICGNGRDLYQGHGVGMSQYGAMGGASLGKSAEEILTFYYKGAVISTINEPTHITIRYCEGSPLYVTPNSNNSCGDYGPFVQKRVSFEDYLSGFSAEMPSHWPVEARKAQIVAARTYALRRTNYGDPNYPICITAACQVSHVTSGIDDQRPLVKATKDKVMTFQGGLIDALYSSDNNQGGGTANCGTRFQDIYGNPSSGCLPYLVSVNDNEWANKANGYWRLWAWKTKTYSYAQFDQFLDWVGNNLYHEFRTAKNQIGNTIRIVQQRDPSGRVNKITIFGTKGNYTLGGWWFKNAWIEWTASRGDNDYVYSQTLNIIQN